MVYNHNITSRERTEVNQHPSVGLLGHCEHAAYHRPVAALWRWCSALLCRVDCFSACAGQWLARQQWSPVQASHNTDNDNSKHNFKKKFFKQICHPDSCLHNHIQSRFQQYINIPTTATRPDSSSHILWLYNTHTRMHARTHTHTDTHTHPFNGPLSETT